MKEDFHGIGRSGGSPWVVDESCARWEGGGKEGEQRRDDGGGRRREEGRLSSRPREAEMGFGRDRSGRQKG